MQGRTWKSTRGKHQGRQGGTRGARHEEEHGYGSLLVRRRCSHISWRGGTGAALARRGTRPKVEESTMGGKAAAGGAQAGEARSGHGRDSITTHRSVAG